MKISEAIELTEIRKKMVQAQCKDCWTDDAEIALQCMYLVRDLNTWFGDDEEEDICLH